MENQQIENYLKLELYNLIKSDSKIFDFIEASFLDGIWYWDIENIENEWMSPRFWNILGYDPATKKHLASEWQDIIFEEDLEIAIENFNKHCIDPDYPYDQIVRYKHKNGSTVWIRCRGVAIRDKNGKPIRMLGVHSDITEQKQKEKAFFEMKSQMEIIFNGTHDSVALISISEDKTFRYEIVNKAFTRIAGQDASKITNKTPKDIFGEEYGNRFIDAYKKCIELNKVLEIEEEVIAQNNKFYFQTTLTPVNEDCEIKYIISSKKDITQIKELEKRLRDERALFKTTLHSLGDAVISSDIYGKIVIMNKAAEELTGWSISEARGLPIETVFNIINEFTKEKVESPIIKVFETDKVVELDNNTLLIQKNGKEIPIEDSAAPIKDEIGNLSGAVIVFRDFTEKKQKQERITYLSYHDQLTGLYNRRYFEEELKRLDKECKLPFTIIMIDVNGLKLINDAFGHLMGDKLLISVAEALSKACSKAETIARIGGDEFVILLPNADNIKAKKLVRRIYSHVEKENKLENVVVSISVGWENKILKEQKTEGVFSKAENFMYKKKLTESQSMRSDTIKVILKTLNETNQREKIHSEKVSSIAKKIAQEMNMDNEKLKEIETAGLMHDIGKIAISKAILDKPGALSTAEYEEIKRHPEIGYHILKSVNEYTKLSEYVLSHHERYDGKGYPRGLKGDEIPVFARIIAVADSFEAMTSNRPYRKALSVEEALEEIIKCKGTQFDPQVVEKFILLFK